MAKFIPMINCGYCAGQSPMVWEINPILFNNEKDCNDWIEDNQDNFSMNELSGGVYPHELDNESEVFYKLNFGLD